MPKVSYTPADLSAQRLAAQQRLTITKQVGRNQETQATTTFARDSVKMASNKLDDRGLSTDSTRVETPASSSPAASAVPATDTAAPQENAQAAPAAASPENKTAAPLSFDAGAAGAGLETQAAPASPPGPPAGPSEASGGSPPPPPPPNDPNQPADPSNPPPSSTNPSDPNAPPSGGGPSDPSVPVPPTPPGQPTSVEMAQRMAEREADARQCQSIFMQMMAERRKAFMEMWKILQDSANAIYGIITGVVSAKAQAVHNAHVSWDKYIRDADK